MSDFIYVWYIIHEVETVLTKYILRASLCFLAFGLESLHCEWKGSASQVGIRHEKQHLFFSLPQ